MRSVTGPLDCVWIIGTGAVGVAFASLLTEQGAAGRIHLSGRRPNPPDHELFRSASTITYSAGLHPPDPTPTAVLISVPDRAIAEVAAALAQHRLSPVPALHTSGALGREALAPLAEAGWATGSLHPLVAIPRSDEGGGSPLRQAWFALEAETTARQFGERIVEVAEGRVLDVAEGGKPLYHAAAVFASNYLVVLLATAERLACEGGADRGDAHEAFTTLAAGALNNVVGLGAERALTGPIARGDVETVKLHLARLSAPDRELYSRLAREALDLARARLTPEIAEKLEHNLGVEE